MASLSHGGPLKCLRIMGKKATAWRMNQFIESVLSLASSLPLSSLSCLFTSPFYLPPFFCSFPSRSVLSWNIYSSPSPASLNRHANSQLNIAQRSLHAFPSVSSPKTQKIGRSHPLCLRRVSIRQPGHVTRCSEDNGCRQERHPRTPWPFSKSLCCPLSCKHKCALGLTSREPVLFCHMTIVAYTLHPHTALAWSLLREMMKSVETCLITEPLRTCLKCYPKTVALVILNG